MQAHLYAHKLASVIESNNSAKFSKVFYYCTDLYIQLLISQLAFKALKSCMDF